ncbi:peptidyl-tRNA hydrolase [Mycena leptocephala]|nr:peptidyl-tRNA hydrolase [Mycena leptocephala]
MWAHIPKLLVAGLSIDVLRCDAEEENFTAEGPCTNELLVVGLGNLPYPNTRHSLGQLIIDELAWRTGIRMSPDRDGFSGESTIILGKTPLTLTLFKSKHLMNISGPSVVAALRKRGLKPDMLIVISDSTQHEVCKVNYRLGGSANGHNGLKRSLARSGRRIPPPARRCWAPSSMDLADYVLGKLSSHERQFWSGDGVDLVCDAIEKVAQKVNG